MPLQRLSRTKAHRTALLRNLATSLLLEESIVTTLAKAKAAQRYTEKVITLAKRQSGCFVERISARIFRPKAVVPKLLNTLVPRYHNRPGGYTRVLRIPNRGGDNAPQAVVELVTGEKELKFGLAARIVAYSRLTDTPLNPTSKLNISKLKMYRPHASQTFEAAVEQQLQLLRQDPAVRPAQPHETDRATVGRPKPTRPAVYRRSGQRQRR